MCDNMVTLYCGETGREYSGNCGSRNDYGVQKFCSTCEESGRAENRRAFSKMCEEDGIN